MLTQSLSPYTTVGDHVTVQGIPSCICITVPNTANGVLLQAIKKDLRVKLGTCHPTTTEGFHLTEALGIVALSLAPGTLVHIIEETSGATLEYQFIRFLEHSEVR